MTDTYERCPCGARERGRMKPLITKDTEGRYWCTPQENEIPDDLATAQEWYAYSAVGCGWTPTEAYNNWVNDCLWEEE